MRKEILQRKTARRPATVQPRPTYVDVLRREAYEKSASNVPQPSFRLVVKPRKRMKLDETRNLIKSSVDPVEMKVGISQMTAGRDGAIIVQTTSREENDLIVTAVNKRQSALTATSVAKLQPRLIIYNIPEEVDKENAAEIIRTQNAGLIGDDNYLEVKTLLTGGAGKSRRDWVV